MAPWAESDGLQRVLAALRVCRESATWALACQRLVDEAGYAGATHTAADGTTSSAGSATRDGAQLQLDDAHLTLYADLARPLGARERAAMSELAAQLTSRERASQRQRRLGAVLAMVDSLLGCDDDDELYRRTIELCRSRLGLERCSLYLREGQVIRGTFGTDCHGRVVDERAVRFDLAEEWLEFWEWPNSIDSAWEVREPVELVEYLDGRRCVLGHGWVAGTPLRLAGGLTGVLFNDCALSGQRPDPEQQDALALFASVMAEIQRRHSAERDLREACRRADSYLNSPGVLLMHIGFDGVVHMLSRAGAAMLDSTPEALVGRDGLATFVAPECREDLRQRFGQLARGERLPEPALPVELLTAAGRRLRVVVHASLLHDASGAADGLLVSAIDLTEQLRQASAARQLAVAAAQTTTALALADTAGCVVYANPSFAALVRKSPESLLGRSLAAVLGRLDGSERGAAAQLAESLEFSGRLLHLTAKGEPRHLQLEVEPVRNEAGTVEYWSATAFDVTAQVQFEAQLQQASRMEAIGLLAGGVAHDFNNVLATIMGYGELLSTALPPTSALRSDAVEIVHAAQRAAGLTRQLLDLGRRQPLSAQPTVLDKALLALRPMLHQLLGAALELRFEQAADDAAVLLDHSQLDQVIVNLVVNARDALGSCGRVTVSTSVVDDQGVVVVSDNGPGLDPSIIDRIFEPFFTTKAGGRGSGLGLATVYSLVTAARGRVTVVSEPGHGASFTVALPLAPRSAVPADLAAPAVVEPAPSGGETILVAEDDPAVRDLVERLLAQHGYRVVSGADGLAAWEAAQAHGGPFDLLLTDVVMPKLTGRELAERVARAWPSAAVLYMTGYADDAMLRYGVRAGEVQLVSKPFTSVSLLQRVRLALADRD